MCRFPHGQVAPNSRAETAGSERKVEIERPKRADRHPGDASVHHPAQLSGLRTVRCSRTRWQPRSRTATERENEENGEERNRKWRTSHLGDGSPRAFRDSNGPPPGELQNDEFRMPARAVLPREGTSSSNHHARRERATSNIHLAPHDPTVRCKIPDVQENSPRMSLYLPRNRDGKGKPPIRRDDGRLKDDPTTRMVLCQSSNLGLAGGR